MTALIATNFAGSGASFENALVAWADRTTALESNRADDISRDKTTAVRGFFGFCAKSIEQVTASDVRRWREQLAEENLAEGTIYNRLTYLSSFYEYLRRDSELARFLPVNPARAALPRAPKAYQTENVKDLSDDELNRLWKVIETAAKTKDDAAYQRDWAIFRLFVATGMRRSEIINLTGNSVELTDDGILLRARVKGNRFDRREVADREAKHELLEYLKRTNRLDVIGTKRPLWLRHDRAAGQAEKPLKTHGFALRMKDYARAAGIKNFHLHRLRHTFARIVAADAGSIFEAQEALGHSNPNTTEHYVKRLKIRKDRYSAQILARITHTELGESI